MSRSLLLDSLLIDFSPTTTQTDNGGRLLNGHNGGVWEWTSTEFQGHDGFEASKLYPGYSADFFDGKHFVVVSMARSQLNPSSWLCSSADHSLLYPVSRDESRSETGIKPTTDSLSLAVVLHTTPRGIQL